ncbi:unnamed protein product [Periconia digitata]|uniref:Uncharacterized protein n=1 Tax=Periconia digitata TaxID=1303443 RepID=A0A9W4XE95_9PLEO|nr:unnamed protein product [Periconia digitata]
MQLGRLNNLLHPSIIAAVQRNCPQLPYTYIFSSIQPLTSSPIRMTSASSSTISSLSFGLGSEIAETEPSPLGPSSPDVIGATVVLATSARQGQTPTRWTSAMIKALLEGLLGHSRNERTGRRGRPIDNTVWPRVRRSVQAVSQDILVLCFDCRRKADQCRKRWDIWQKMMAQPGFGVNQDGRITAPSDILEAYLRLNFEARALVSRPLQHVGLHRQLFGLSREMGSQTQPIPLDYLPTLPQGSRDVAGVWAGTAGPASSFLDAHLGTRGELALEKLVNSVESMAEAMDRLCSHQIDSQELAISTFLDEYGELTHNVKEYVCHVFQNQFESKRFVTYNVADRGAFLTRFILLGVQTGKITRVEADMSLDVINLH